MKLNTATKSIELTGSCYLRVLQGKAVMPVTGLPNLPIHDATPSEWDRKKNSCKVGFEIAACHRQLKGGVVSAKVARLQRTAIVGTMCVLCVQVVYFISRNCFKTNSNLPAATARCCPYVLSHLLFSRHSLAFAFTRCTTAVLSTLVCVLVRTQHAD